MARQANSGREASDKELRHGAFQLAKKAWDEYHEMQPNLTLG